MNQQLLSELTVRSRIVLSVILLVIDQLYVAAMRPRRPHVKPTGRRTTKAISLLTLTLLCLMWV
ncbi:MAG: hypothetical protein VYA30_07815 [Myxococcota bacterium]|nr:hypothetical protein [Myxococcota bacterium]